MECVVFFFVWYIMNKVYTENATKEIIGDGENHSIWYKHCAIVSVGEN